MYYYFLHGNPLDIDEEVKKLDWMNQAGGMDNE